MKKIKKNILKLRFYELNNEIELNKEKKLEINKKINKIENSIRYFYLKDTITKIESNLDVKYKIETTEVS